MNGAIGIKFRDLVTGIRGFVGGLGNALATYATEVDFAKINPNSAGNCWNRVKSDWNYTMIDHADASPVAVSGGVPALLGGVTYTEGSSDAVFNVRDDTTDVYPINCTSVAMVERQQYEGVEGAHFLTDLNVEIATAGTAGKIVVKWKAFG